MRQDSSEASRWLEIKNNKVGWGQAEVRKRSRWQMLGMGISMGLLLLVGWGIVAIYGPVVRAEAEYQWRSLGLSGRRSWLLPRFEFRLLPEVIGEGWGMVIPKIFLQEKVVANVDPADKEGYLAALNEGIAQAAGTALPGEPGLGYYFAHSSGMNPLWPQKEATFYLLGKLEIGDRVLIYRQGEKYEYHVVEKRVVAADDLSFLAEGEGEEAVVLQTCWPVGTSLKRLVVIAGRVG